MSSLNHISPYLFVVGLSDIEFTSLNKIDTTTWGYGDEYCRLQTNPFKSTQELIHTINLLNNNTKLESAINNMYLQSDIDGKLENTRRRDAYFEQISDILLEWMQNPNKSALLEFRISNINDENSDFKYSERFAVCLCNKIDNNNNNGSDNNNNRMNNNRNKNKNKKGECLNSLKIGEFVGPYYGGDSNHFVNTISINDRIRIGVHMKQIDDNLTQFEKKIQLFVEMKPVTMKRLFGGEKNLITCTCKRSSDVNWRSIDGSWL